MPYKNPGRRLICDKLSNEMLIINTELMINKSIRDLIFLVASFCSISSRASSVCRLFAASISDLLAKNAFKYLVHLRYIMMPKAKTLTTEIIITYGYSLAGLNATHLGVAVSVLGTGGGADGEHRQAAQHPQQIDAGQLHQSAAKVHEFGIRGKFHRVSPFFCYFPPFPVGCSGLWMWVLESCRRDSSYWSLAKAV